MDLTELKKQNYRDNYLQFDPSQYGRIYTFLDFANVRQWAKTFWPNENKLRLVREIDIAKLYTLISSVSPEKSLFYYGYYKEDPELSERHEHNIRHRKSLYRISKAQKSGFKTVAKEIKEIKSFDEFGKFIGTVKKCNLDIEIAIDMLTKVEKYDTIFLWSGDSDFDRLLKHLKVTHKKKVIVVCCRDFMSKELAECADVYVPADAFKDILEFINEATPTEVGVANKDEPNIP